MYNTSFAENYTVVEMILPFRKKIKMYVHCINKENKLVKCVSKDYFF